MLSVIQVLSHYLIVNIPDCEMPYALEDEVGDLVLFFASYQEALEAAMRFETMREEDEKARAFFESIYND